MVHLSFLSLNCTYWYIWIAAIYKKANKLIFFFLIWKKSHLEATGRRSVAPTKTATFPVLYFEASHSMYFLLRPKLCSHSLPCVWHCCMRCLVWLQGWTVSSVTPVPQSRRDLLQAVTEGLVFPTGLSTTQLGCAGACTSVYHCRTWLFPCLWPSLFSSSLCWPHWDPDWSCRTHAETDAGTVRDECGWERCR